MFSNIIQDTVFKATYRTDDPPLKLSYVRRRTTNGGTTSTSTAYYNPNGDNLKLIASPCREWENPQAVGLLIQLSYNKKELRLNGLEIVQGAEDFEMFYVLGETSYYGLLAKRVGDNQIVKIKDIVNNDIITIKCDVREPRLICDYPVNGNYHYYYPEKDNLRAFTTIKVETYDYTTNSQLLSDTPPFTHFIRLEEGATSTLADIPIEWIITSDTTGLSFEKGFYNYSATDGTVDIYGTRTSAGRDSVVQFYYEMYGQRKLVREMTV